MRRIPAALFLLALAGLGVSLPGNGQGPDDVQPHSRIEDLEDLRCLVRSLELLAPQLEEWVARGSSVYDLQFRRVLSTPTDRVYFGNAVSAPPTTGEPGFAPGSPEGLLWIYRHDSGTEPDFPPDELWCQTRPSWAPDHPVWELRTPAELEFLQLVLGWMDTGDGPSAIGDLTEWLDLDPTVSLVRLQTRRWADRVELVLGFEVGTGSSDPSVQRKVRARVTEAGFEEIEVD